MNLPSSSERGTKLTFFLEEEAYFLHFLLVSFEKQHPKGNIWAMGL